MRVRYVGIHDVVEVALPDEVLDGRSVRVRRGEAVTLPDDFARSLLEQPANWQLVSLMGSEPAEQKLTGVRPHELVRRALLHLRRQRGWTQRKLAEQLQGLGYPLRQPQIALIENGRRQITIDDLIAICAALNTSPHHVLAGSMLPQHEQVAASPATIVPPGRYRAWIRGSQPLPRNPAWDRHTDGGSQETYRTTVDDEQWLEMQRNDIRMVVIAVNDLIDNLRSCVHKLARDEREAVADTLDRLNTHVDALNRSDNNVPSQRPARRERRGRPRKTTANRTEPTAAGCS